MEKFFFPLAFALLLLGCEKPENPPDKVIFSGVAMTIPYQVAIRGKLSSDEKNRVEEKIEEIFLRTHRLFNKFNPISEISLINRLEQGEEFLASPQVLDIFQKCSSYLTMTHGLFDPSVEGSGNGFENIQLVGNKVVKKRANAAFDFGGIAKGTTIDALLDGMRGMGYLSTLVEWGGDFAVSTSKKGEVPWRIALFDPSGKEEIVELWEGALATSGDYEQHWMEGDKTLFHIYHPKERRFLSQEKGHVMSVSVRAKTAEEADVLATTFLVLETEEKGKKFLQELGRNDLKVWWKVR